MTDTKKTFIISIVAVVLFIASIVAVSYAFYTSQTKTDGTGVNFQNITAEISTTLNDDNKLDVTMIPGDTFEKTFSITNNAPDLTFYIAVLDLTNTFKTPSDITYVLTADEEQIGSGTFPSTATDGSANLSTNTVTIKNGETKNYKLTITYKDDEKRDQSDDMGSKISGKIFIKGV